MKTKIAILISLAVIALSSSASAVQASSRDFRIDNPYVGGNAYKGQLHTHTTNSDGSLTPVELATEYKALGYDFLSITDHDFVTPDPEVGGILHILGNEISSKLGHLVEWGSEIYSLAHPDNPYDGKDGTWTEAEIALTDFSCIEVYTFANARKSNYKDRIAEEKWDYALSNPTLRRVWGVAVDDFHLEDYPRKYMDMGWVILYADTLTVDDVLKSLKGGNFYASSGPDMTTTVVDKTITVTTSDSSTITWKKVGGEIIQISSNTTSSSYTAIGNEVYIRIVVTRDGKKAWSQPFFIRGKNPRLSVFMRFGWDTARYYNTQLRSSIDAPGEYDGIQYMLYIPIGCEIEGRISWLWLSGIDDNVLSFAGRDTAFSKPCILYIAKGGQIYKNRRGEWVGGGEWVEVGSFTSIVDGKAYLIELDK